MQRACAAGLLTNGTTILANPGKSNDDLAAIDTIQKLGAHVTPAENGLQIESNGTVSGSGAINCGESGLGLRMFAPVAALSHNEIVLNGGGSLVTRPMNFFDEIFPLLDISIQSNNGRLPIRIKGPLQPRDITIDGSLSSQFLTGLLMAFAKACTGPVTIRVNDLKSKPYIDLTITVLRHFGWDVENRDYTEFYFKPAANGGRRDITYAVEGDWSSASFLLVAGAIAGDISVEGLDTGSTQADKAVLEALKLAGTEMIIGENLVKVHAQNLEAFEFDATDCPDLFPPLVALASYCTGVSYIRGVSRLAHKESNRGITLQTEFGKMGVGIALQGDMMSVSGGNFPAGAALHSSHDHRIAMACAVAALRADGQTTIVAAEAVDKSYPDFFDHLKRLHASLQIT